MLHGPCAPEDHDVVRSAPREATHEHDGVVLDAPRSLVPWVGTRLMAAGALDLGSDRGREQRTIAAAAKELHDRLGGLPGPGWDLQRGLSVGRIGAFVAERRQCQAVLLSERGGAPAVGPPGRPAGSEQAES
jgi:hypothetical protein